eukprot:TRINITY_DN3207_c0_g1_i1.p1 TRINITY_DN3207_c0_g1~~TRINITY_DN3207_c0_g1_i1.p1  ORF type:complete len:292 (-),score=45.56 TRINITY_DN3207_c0_g1_i1:46-921(-)
MEQEAQGTETLLSITPLELYNLRSHSSWGINIVDLRDKKSFDDSHIAGSCNTPNESPDEEKIKILKAQKNSRWFGNSRMILVTDSGDNIQEMRDLLTQSFDSPNIQTLEGGFKAFHDKFPFICLSGEKLNFDDYSEAWPSIILEDFLYLSGWPAATYKAGLDSLEIKNIVNCTPDDPPYPSEYTYLHINIDDYASQNITIHFEKAIEFIREVRNKNEKVLVHCHAGISRSATIVIAYLMTEHKWTLKQTYGHVKTHRKIISPNPGFIRQLSEYELKLYGTKTDVWTGSQMY